CVAMLFFEIYAVFWTMDGISAGMGGYRLGILFLVPSPVLLFYVGGVAAKFYYIFLVTAVIVSFILVLYNSREGLLRVLRGDTDRMDDMPMYGVATLFAMYISMNLILVLLVSSFGYDPASPEDPAEEWMLWYSLLNASVWEEVICRVLMIGVPLMAAGLALKEKGSWKRLFGHSEMDRFAVVFIIFSAVMFAYGHLSGWDLFKLIPTFVCGLALGYLFVKYGLYASIMLHFLVDYLSSFVWMFDSVAADMLLSLFILSMVVLGAPFIVLYARRGISHLKKVMSS
ncbi:MAG: CPBP family glutamic-type intramembrane protease, partial [Methanomassiliicoccaceae archaeon]|nr:CPBP family glutamic-type intramembrane protease [Methanomassiliicoccaceae archaeon]